MEEITVYVGQVVVISNGAQQDTRRPVKFVGEKLGEHREYKPDKRDPEKLSDTRGITQTLYKAEDGRLIAFVEEWSRWQGEPNEYWLKALDTRDLGPGGDFEALGRACGMGRPLTLDEALGG